MKTAKEMTEYSAQRYVELVEEQKLEIEHDIMSEAYKGKLRTYMGYIYPENVDWLIGLGYTVDKRTDNICIIEW